MKNDLEQKLEIRTGGTVVPKPNVVYGKKLISTLALSWPRINNDNRLKPMNAQDGVT